LTGGIFQVPSRIEGSLPCHLVKGNRHGTGREA
jgi:hypothetical protein